MLLVEVDQRQAGAPGKLRGERRLPDPGEPMTSTRFMGSGEVEADAEALAFAGQHFVAQPALPHQQQSGARLDADKAVRALRRGHHQRQARVLEADRARASGRRDVKSAGNDAVRVDVSTVMPTGFQQICPQAVELWLALPPELARERRGVAGEEPGEVGERRVAAWQIVER